MGSALAFYELQMSRNFCDNFQLLTLTQRMNFNADIFGCFAFITARGRVLMIIIRLRSNAVAFQVLHEIFWNNFTMEFLWCFFGNCGAHFSRHLIAKWAKQNEWGDEFVRNLMWYILHRWLAWRSNAIWLNDKLSDGGDIDVPRISHLR